MRNYFKVGDVVQSLDQDIKCAFKKTGVIIRLNGKSADVEFYENVQGHSCNGLAKRGHGWFISLSHLKLLRFDIMDNVREMVNNIYKIPDHE